jgi:hypothetical protein
MFRISKDGSFFVVHKKSVGVFFFDYDWRYEGLYNTLEEAEAYIKARSKPLFYDANGERIK